MDNNAVNVTMTEEIKRGAVLAGLHAGRSPKAIAEFNKLSLSFVYKMKSRLEAAEHPEDINTKRSKPAPRSDNVRTPEFVARVQQKVDQDPSKSIRSLARELGVANATIHRTVHEDLRYGSYALKTGHFMNDATKQKRLEKAKKLLIRLKHPEEAKMLKFFSDEKNFDQDQKVNRRNDRWLCKSPDEVPRVMHTKFPSTVMVLGVVSSEGDVMPPFFFQRGLRVNASEYIKVLEDTVKPWMDGVANGRPYVFQQDSAPAHKARATQNWLADNVPYHWSPELWPPSSPDLNPLDYYVWGVVERETNARPHNTIQSVKDTVYDVMTNMSRAHLVKACERFRPRIEAVIAAEGGFIE